MSFFSKSNPDARKSAPSQSKLAKSETKTAQKNPLRDLSADDFCNLGLEQVVYVRAISARQLKEFVPEAQSMPGDVQFQMIVGANGVPVLIADNQIAIDEWFEQNDVESLPRH